MSLTTLLYNLWTKPKVSTGKYHPICGKNIRFSEEYTVAERVDSHSHGIVYTEQPVPVGTIFQIKLLQKHDPRTQYSASLAFGFTTEKPGKTLEPSYLQLSYNLNCWILNPFGGFCHGTGPIGSKYALRIVDLEVGQSLGCVVNENGSLYYFVDGKDHGLACTGLPTDQPLWGFVGIYGKAKKIKSDYHINQQGRLQETEQLLVQNREEVEEREQKVQDLQQRLDTSMAELRTSPQVASQ